MALHYQSLNLVEYAVSQGRHVMTKTDHEVRAAIAYAVHYAIAVVGISGLKKTSMFSSNERVAQDLKQAA